MIEQYIAYYPFKYYKGSTYSILLKKQIAECTGAGLFYQTVIHAWNEHDYKSFQANDML